MRTTFRIASLLACMLMAVVLSGTEARYEFFKPGFNPAPWVSAYSPGRQTVIDNIMEQGFDQDWFNSYRYTAEYDAQGRLSAQKGSSWDVDTQSWIHNYTLSPVYRPDNHLLRVDIIALLDGEWQDYGVVDYLYENNLLRSARYDLYTDQGREPWWQAAFYYLPNTFILNKVVEIYYFNGPAPGSMRKYEYSWDAGSRPSEIIESVSSEMSNWVIQARHTYVYHNDDQTTHAAYMRMLEYGFVFLDRMVSGIQPTKLLEHRNFSQPYGTTSWTEMYRDFYVYDANNQLLRIDKYDQVGPNQWEVNWQQTYEYEGGLPVTETWWSDSDGNDVLTSDHRMVYAYTQITDADDPVATPIVSKLKVYPNPFNPQTGISYKLEASAQTEVSVYNLKGQKVRTLQNGASQPGEHNLSWDGRDDQGRDLAAGIYLIRLDAGKKSSMVKAVLAK